MKALLFWLVIFSMASVSAVAQTADKPAPSPEIQFLKVGVQRVAVPGPKSRAVARVDPTSLQRRRAQNQSDPDRSPALHRLSKDAEVASEYNPTGGYDGFEPVPTKFVASVVVKNISKKTIQAISWEYLLFEPGKATPVKRYQARNKVEIVPNGIAELTKDVQIKGKEHQAAIVRIEYADGTFWQRP